MFKNCLTRHWRPVYASFEPVQNMATKKAAETERKILQAALDLFREEGFDDATMRAIAARAGVATGAAYYYFPSKDAIVLAFYEQSCAEMQPRIAAALDETKG